MRSFIHLYLCSTLYLAHRPFGKYLIGLPDTWTVFSWCLNNVHVQWLLLFTVGFQNRFCVESNLLSMRLLWVIMRSVPSWKIQCRACFSFYEHELRYVFSGMNVEANGLVDSETFQVPDRIEFQTLHAVGDGFLWYFCLNITDKGACISWLF